MKSITNAPQLFTTWSFNCVSHTV